MLKSAIIDGNFKKDQYSSTFIFESNSTINDIILPEPINCHYFCQLSDLLFRAPL